MPGAAPATLPSASTGQIPPSSSASSCASAEANTRAFGPVPAAAPPAMDAGTAAIPPPGSARRAV